MQPTPLSIKANGLRHNVLEWDGGGRTTVLCLHGFLDASWAFHEVAPALAADGHHVVAPDLRGHGDTDWIGPGGYYHFMDYVLDVADLVDALARDRLALVGHSMGGSISALFGGTFPDRCWKIALMEGMRAPEASPQEFPSRLVTWIRSVRRVRSGRQRVFASIDEAAARIRAHDPRCPAAEARFLAEMGTRPVGGGWVFKHDPLHQTKAPYPFYPSASFSCWEAISCPVLLIDGAESPPPPFDLRSRYAAFRNARKVEIEGAGHMMMRHRPTAVATEIATFLREP